MRLKNKVSGLKIALPGLLLFLLLGPVLLAGCGSSADLQFPTEYQAVFMDNGQVFFGRVKSSGPNYLTLRDVFYIQRQVLDDKQKERRNILLKRGSEWHGPDFMVINVRHVVLIEPVAPDSRVAQLIRQAHSPMAPAPAAPAPSKEKAPPAKEKPAPSKAKPAPDKDKKTHR